MPNDKTNKFSTLRPPSDTTEAPTVPESEAGKGEIITYGTLDRRKVPNEEKKVKIPLDIIDLVNDHAQERANHTLIYTWLMERGAEALREALLLGEVEIKY